MNAIQSVYLLLLLFIVIANYYLAIKMKERFLKRTFYFSSGTLVVLLTILSDVIPIKFIGIDRWGVDYMVFTISLMIILPSTIFVVNKLACHFKSN